VTAKGACATVHGMKATRQRRLLSDSPAPSRTFPYSGKYSGKYPGKERGLLRAVFLAILCLTVVASARGATTFPKPTGYVDDFANQLDPADRDRIEQLLQRIDERLQVQFAVVTMPTIGDDDPTDYANRLYEAWGIGNKKTDRGVLILDVMDQHYLKIEVGYGLEGVLNDAKTGDVRRDVMNPLLHEGRRAEAYVAGVRALAIPILEDMGESPATLDSLIRGQGYSVHRASRGRGNVPLPVIIAIAIIFLILGGGGRRRRRGLWMMGGPWGGGFGGFGGFGGGGGGGGFGGFGGGLSGGGGSGGRY
jgi:uncharacterized protein